MIIRSVAVKNFRCILDETLECDMLTALVGANGAGKSTFLRAIELFYAGSPSVTAEDFYAEDVNQVIEVSVTFAELDSEEQEHFSNYVENGTLTVSRVFSFAEGKVTAKYHGSLLQNPDFIPMRIVGGAREATAAYNELRQNPAYAEQLVAVRSRDAALESLRKWEEAHPDRCTRQRDEGQFFGFTEVAQGYLGRYTRYIPVPAVRDAAEDAAESKGSPITMIMDLVVRSVLAQREDVARLKTDTQTRYNEIFDPEHLVELDALEDRLSTTLATYVPDAAVDLSWERAKPIEIPMPTAQVKLLEDGFRCAVERTGHGLQRAFILALLQHLAVAVAPTPPEQAGAAPPAVRSPNLILGIEEPELYQHPNRQRHLARILLALSNGRIPGVAGRTQVLYGTHSPLFVGIDRFDQVRLLRKVSNGDARPKVAKVTRKSLDDVARILWKARGRQGEQFTADTLRPRLQTIMTPWMSEGFFATEVVLVEGEDDRAAVLGFASAAGHDFESLGISVIPCIGKNNLDRPLVIFRNLGIAVYVIWDSDYGGRDADPADNRYLLHLAESAPDDWPNTVQNTFACFRTKLEDVLRSEIGNEVFTALLNESKTQFGIRQDSQAIKNPTVISQVVSRARAQGQTSQTLEAVVERIVELRRKQVAV
jgi:hypothetical protein